MDENIFKNAVAAISSGEYSIDDVKVTKMRLDELKKEETLIKRRIEQEKNAFVKNKDKSTSKLKKIRGEIRTIKNILKNNKGDL
jgi:hypothetical protein